ncbi:hypothetical protein [Gimesia maris]|uniref:hypothetical protein n=1 Tax=Gimesia maris TaxID=122 RepID=UPI00241F77B4|nr:hypothetical protein [Gimesia maris]|tara:strand:- start:123558 stop:123977 length:420 start_codon:yes stop_codon:yes gene_type:complete
MPKKKTARTAASRQARRSGQRKKTQLQQNLSSSLESKDQVMYRVYPVDDLLLEAMTEKRRQQGLTIQKLIRASIENHLCETVEQLHGMGLAHESSLNHNKRWPLDSGVLAAIQLASAQTKVSQKDLLIACLKKYCSKLK